MHYILYCLNPLQPRGVSPCTQKATTKLIIVELLPTTYVVSKFSVILSQVNIACPHKEETFSP